MVNYTSVQRINGAWHYEWAPALGTVRIVLWGYLLEATDDNEYTYSSALYDSRTLAPPVEVVLDGEEALSEKNLCFLTLQWHRVECRHYEVEYKDGADWVSVGTITDDSLISIQTYRTPLLLDQTLTQWRVIARDEDKREGEPLPFELVIVRPPDQPSIPELSCESGTLTIT